MSSDDNLFDVAKQVLIIYIRYLGIKIILKIFHV